MGEFINHFFLVGQQTYHPLYLVVEMSPSNFVYSTMIWRTRSFLEKLPTQENSLFCGKFDVYPVKKQTAIIVKTPEDLMLADLLMQSLKNINDDYKISYTKIK